MNEQWKSQINSLPSIFWSDTSFFKESIKKELEPTSLGIEGIISKAPLNERDALSDVIKGAKKCKPIVLVKDNRLVFENPLTSSQEDHKVNPQLQGSELEVLLNEGSSIVQAHSDSN